MAAEFSEVHLAIRNDDAAAFETAVDRYRREIQVHCYRMLGSRHDAEDVVQETFLRAWDKRSTFRGDAPLRAWLYRIATNACIDLIRQRSRVITVDPREDEVVEIPWLEPYPDSLLPDASDPAAATVAKETIELAYVAAIQHLPPSQRAVLLLRDAMGWSAKETAELLDISVAAANSALQRARETLGKRVAGRDERTVNWQPSDEERKLLSRFMRATEDADMAGMAQLLKDDAVFWMPPEPGVFIGRDTIIESWTPFLSGPTRIGDFKMLPVRCNNQLAAANYLRPPGGDTYERLSIDVLRIEDGAIAEIVTFGHSMFDDLGLPERF